MSIRVPGKPTVAAKSLLKRNYSNGRSFDLRGEEVAASCSGVFEGEAGQEGFPLQPFIWGPVRGAVCGAEAAGQPLQGSPVSPAGA